MVYNFDEEIERRGTQCLKFDKGFEIWQDDSVIPMWVADMDFATPPFVMDAIKRRLDTRILGYAAPYDAFYDSIIHWNKKRHGMDVAKEEICPVAGVVAGMRYATQAFTDRGDNVMIMQPVYHPFRNVTTAIGRTIVDCPLKTVNGRYEIDFPLMESLLPKCKVFILCNPHNPGGFTWSADKLREIARLCRKYGVVVIDDEIHSDLTLKGYKHVPFLSVGEDAVAVGVTLQSPSKAFNMPGVVGAYTIVKNPELRDRFFNYLEGSDSNLLSVFSYDCIASCFTDEGEEWLGQMLDYIKGNIDYVSEFCKENMPKIRPLIPEASFLVFLDCTELGLDGQKGVDDFFAKKAKLALNSGETFGPEAIGFMRLNIGCTRRTLEKAMRQLKEAYDSLA